MNEFFSKALFFRLALVLVLGILTFEIFGFLPLLVTVLLIIGIIFVPIIFLFKNSKSRYSFEWLFATGIYLIIFVLGYFLSYNFDKNIPRFENNIKQGIFEITLTDFPIEKQNSVLLYAEINSFSDSSKTEKFNGNIRRQNNYR